MLEEMQVEDHLIKLIKWKKYVKAQHDQRAGERKENV